MNPHGERVRAELENQQLVWEAAFGANNGNAFVLWELHRAIADLWKRRPNLKIESAPCDNVPQAICE
jgi:hypothetical protein